MSKVNDPKPGDLMVWYMPQVGFGIPAFEVAVPDVKTGRLVQKALAQFSFFEYSHKIKGDYADGSGVARWESDGEDGFDWFMVDEEEED